MKRKLFLLISLLWLAVWAIDQETDSERLGRAIDYFQSGKYHEAMLIFEQLNAKYKLNPRFHGYLGVCYYYDWQYEEAAATLAEVMPKLEVFAPHERAVYYFTCADAHFQTGKYEEAIPYYEKALNVCYENEKPEIYYKLAFCELRTGNKEKANQQFTEAMDYYSLYHTTPQLEARISQMHRIIDDTQQELTATVIPIDDPMVRDTLRFDVPTDLHLDDLFENGIEVEEEPSE